MSRPHDDPDTWGDVDWFPERQSLEVEVTDPHVFGVIHLPDGSEHLVVEHRPIGFEVPK